jgi:hypothetical protein
MAGPKEHLVSIGLEDLPDTMELGGARLVILTRSLTIKRLVKYLAIPLLLRPFARLLRLINYATETRYGTPPNSGAGGEMSTRKGLIQAVTFVDGGHYQNPALWPTFCPARLLHINATLRRSARQFLDSLGEPAHRPAFIHVRRGDYLSHSDYGLKDFALPAEFYRRAILEYERRAGATHFLFVTDDPQWIEDNFADIAAKSTSSFDAAMDFAIMTECGGGILSNSTFSLAAALMMDHPTLLIGPQYWFGFRVARWLPPLIKANHEKIIYLPVLPDGRSR